GGGSQTSPAGKWGGQSLPGRSMTMEGDASRLREAEITVQLPGSTRVHRWLGCTGSLAQRQHLRFAVDLQGDTLPVDGDDFPAADGIADENGLGVDDGGGLLGPVKDPLQTECDLVRVRRRGGSSRLDRGGGGGIGRGNGGRGARGVLQGESPVFGNGLAIGSLGCGEGRDIRGAGLTGLDRGGWACATRRPGSL